MANDDLIRRWGGLVPATQPYGQVKGNWYKLTTGGSTVEIYFGMPMDMDANGQVVPYTVASNNLSIGPALAFSDTNRASIPSAMATLSAGPYLPGNTDAYVFIADDPDQEFYIQEATNSTALTQAAAGANATIRYRSTSGSTVTGWSTVEIDRASIGTTTGGLLQLIKPADGPTNSDGTDNAPGNYCKWVVKIFLHRFNGFTGSPI